MLSFVRVRGAGLFFGEGLRGLTFVARILVRVRGVVVWGWVRHTLCGQSLCINTCSYSGAAARERRPRGTVQVLRVCPQLERQ